MSNEFQLVYPTCAFCEVCQPSVVIGVSSNGQFDFNEGWNTDKVWHEIQAHKAIIQDEYGKNYSCTEFIAHIKGYQMHPSIQRQQELEEAEELLTKVCELVIDVTAETSEGSCLTQLEQVTCLPEWWTKRKPKSEREKKLEKIQSTIKTWWADGEDRAQFRMAEEILKALENGV